MCKNFKILSLRNASIKFTYKGKYNVYFVYVVYVEREIYDIYWYLFYNASHTKHFIM